MPRPHHRRLFEPFEVGTMRLRNRIIVPTHAAGAGQLLGSERDAERFIAYYARRARGGAAWIGGSATFVQSPLIPGYEPSGVGAVARGTYRHPLFVERQRRFVDVVHAEGARVVLQMIVQGGLPHGASQDVSGLVLQEVPHALTRAEIATQVAEYGWSAQRALEAGVDGLEIHANHDDLVQFFLSPLSNRRDDEYGGPLANRLRFLLEALTAVRGAVGSALTLGARLCMDELVDGGYDAEEGRAIARAVAGSGLVDYLHLDVGNNWGAPSYLPPMQYGPLEWARMAGRIRGEVAVPVVYTGRVSHPDLAEEILAQGHADLVGMARALVADPDLPAKARAGRLDALRPCVATNDCLHRVIVDGMRFSCAVNPAAGHETIELTPAPQPRRILVVGGGPAGMEAAAVAAQRGHEVTLWERTQALGGQLAIAARAPAQGAFDAFITSQRRRLDTAGVTVETGRDATAAAVAAFGADAVVLATGARARVPNDVPGTDLPHVIELRDLLSGRAVAGERVLLAVGDENAAPLLGADFLATRGAAVKVLYPAPHLTPKVGKYSIGAFMQRLFEAGTTFHPMQRLVRIEPDAVHTADVYAGVPAVHRDVDTVVLAYGGRSRDELVAELSGRVPELHVTGDAWAPRRLTVATRQAWELGRRL